MTTLAGDVPLHVCCCFSSARQNPRRRGRRREGSICIMLDRKEGFHARRAIDVSPHRSRSRPAAIIWIIWIQASIVACESVRARVL